jgi:tetratricopeptide (TPR) repeat protein
MPFRNHLAAAAFFALTCTSLSAAQRDPTLDFLEDRVARDELDFIAWNKLGEKYLQLLRLNGDDGMLAKAAHAAEASLKAVGADLNPGGLSLRGRAELAAHRFAAARDTAAALETLTPGRIGPVLLRADALLELGKYAEAEKAIAEAARLDEFDDGIALTRQARLDLVYGRLQSAGERLADAWWRAKNQLGNEETAAWCAVQSGELAFRQGQWERAEWWYDAARAALPAWYAIEDHFAELRAAQGRFEEAVSLYEKLVARVRRPELFQALGDVQVFAGKPELAQPWFAKARTLYTRSAERDDVLYLHHGSGFFADSVNEAETAVAWARKDLEQRQTIQAWDALAWAEYRAGHLKEAAPALEQALATGAKDPHLLYHASMIRMSGGDLAGGKAALREAVAINPRYNTFHAHR